MAAVSGHRATLDRVTYVEAIRGIFARSVMFPGATPTEPRLGPEGNVTVDLSFNQGPAALRVTAPSEETAYAILHELAGAMVEMELTGHLS